MNAYLGTNLDLQLVTDRRRHFERAAERNRLVRRSLRRRHERSERDRHPGQLTPQVGVAPVVPINVSSPPGTQHPPAAPPGAQPATEAPARSRVA